MRRFTLLALSVGLLGCGSGDQEAVNSASTEASQTESTAKTDQTEASPVDRELQSTLNRTNKLLQVGNYQQAMDVISRAMVNNPESSALHRVRAILHHKTGQPSSAMTDYTQAVRLDPENAHLQDEVGFYLFSVGEVSAAEKYIQEAVQLDPKFAQAWNHLGLVQIARGELSKARTSLSEALKLNPKFVDAFINRGFVAYRLKQFDKATDDYNRALEINPDAVNAHNNLGLIDYSEENYQDAVACFTKCIMLDDKNPKYFEHRRMAYLKLGMNEQARNDERRWKQLQQKYLISQQISRQPANPVGYLARAEFAFREERYQDALIDFDRALQLNSQLHQALFGRARARFAMEKYDLVVQDCTEAIKRNPLQPIYSLRGEAYLKLNKYDQAIADFHEAKRLDSTVAEAFLKKADELESLGQTEAAEDYRKQAQSFTPNVDLTPSAN